jgi:methylmalonyl-CoA mutase cobalamin-binding subunit
MFSVSQAWRLGHKTLVPQVIDELKKLGRDDIMVLLVEL